MRTTIELRPEHRARLSEIAARRGEKGLSALIAEAIENYLACSTAERQRLRARALRLRGRFSARDAKRLRREIRKLRRGWVLGSIREMPAAKKGHLKASEPLIRKDRKR